MKLTALAVLTVLVCALAIAKGPSISDKGSDLLVTTDWLAKHLNDENLVLLHAHWTKSSYKKGHIPGARFLWLNALSKDTPDRSTELPSEKDGAAVLNDLGITDHSRIVVYFEGGNMAMSTRMILTLTYLGLGDRVSLLDGGFEAWKNEKRPVTREILKVKPGTFVPTLHPEVVADAEWVRAHESDPDVTIIDARAQRFYDGKAGSPPGHIPHAVSIPFSNVADSTNRMLDLETLRQVFVKAGVKPGSKIVTYCHVGQAASLVYFAAKCLGYDARVYDGSFEDWSDLELPVENPSEKK